MKKLIFFLIIKQTTFAHQEDKIDPLISSWDRTAAAILDAVAFYMGYYYKEDLVFCLRDAGYLLETALAVNENSQYPVHSKKITGVYLTRNTGGEYALRTNIREHFEARGVNQESEDLTVIDTGYGGSLRFRFPNAKWHFLLSFPPGDRFPSDPLGYIPSTFQYFSRINPQSVLVKKDHKIKRSLQHLENTLPKKHPKVIRLFSSYPHDPHCDDKENIYTTIEQVSSSLYDEYVSMMKDQIANEETQRNFTERFEIWKKFRIAMDDQNVDVIESMIQFYWCDNPKAMDDFHRLAIAFDMLELLSRPAKFWPKKGFKIFNDFVDKKEKLTISGIEYRKQIIEEFFPYFFQNPDYYDSFSESDISKMLSESFDSNKLFNLYLALGAEKNHLNLKFHKAFGRFLGYILSQRKQDYDQFYQLIFSQANCEGHFAKDLAWVCPVEIGIIEYLRENNGDHILDLIVKDILTTNKGVYSYVYDRPFLELVKSYVGK